MKKKLLLKSAILAAMLASSLFACSCGPVVRVKITGTKDGVNVQTTQTAKDSTGLNINVNPNINLNPRN